MSTTRVVLISVADLRAFLAGHPGSIELKQFVASTPACSNYWFKHYADGTREYAHMAGEHTASRSTIAEHFSVCGLPRSCEIGLTPQQKATPDTLGEQLQKAKSAQDDIAAGQVLYTHRVTSPNT